MASKKASAPAGIRFEDELLAEIERIRAREGRSRNDVVNRLIRKGLQAEGAVSEDDPRMPGIVAATVDLEARVRDLRKLATGRRPGSGMKGGAGAQLFTFEPPARLEVAEKRSSFGNDVDEPQELHETELEVVHYAAAGKDGHPEPTPTGETVLVANPIARIAIRNKWRIVKVIGDSMEPEYKEGDFVVLQPVDGDVSLLREEDTYYVQYEGEMLLKKLKFRRARDGQLADVKLISLNPKRKPISVGAEDQFAVIGREEYHIKARGRFR